MSVAVKAYDEIVDLFARGASSTKVRTFRPSRSARQRARYLLQRNKTGGMTPEERAELERLGELEHLMQLVKARAQLYAKRSS